jgi:uncharacterized protein (TIGR03086 family)
MAEVAATGPGLVEAHAQGLEHTRGYVAGTARDSWSAPTPCEDWDARQLLDHITTGNLWVAELTAGRTIDEVGDRLDGDQVGTDPVLGYEVSSRAADAAWRRAGALTEAVAVSYGPVPGEVYLGHRCIDVLVHGWDLAAATGQNRTLPPSLVEVLWEVIEPQVDMVVGSGAFGTDHEAEDDDDLQSRILHLLGRDPAWNA